MVMYAERKQTSDSTPNDEDPIFGFRGATTHTTGTDAKVYMGILNGVLPSPEHNITVSNLSAGVVIETDRITTHPGMVLNPTTTTIAPDTKGSIMYDSGSDELKYYDGSWQIVSAGGLSAHALDGVYHTATGLTVGWVISADSATTFSWKAPTGGMTAHDLTGAYHTEDATGGAGNFLKADSATTFSWQAHGLGASDVGAYTTAQTDTAIDTDIATHAALATVHQDAPALISTHASDDDAHHALVTVGGAPLTLSGQAVTFNYDSNHFKLTGNNLQVGTDIPGADQILTWVSGKAEWADATISGTQWTLPVFTSTSTIGDSMLSQDLGGTTLTVDGDITSPVNLNLLGGTGWVDIRAGSALTTYISAGDLILFRDVDDFNAWLVKLDTGARTLELGSVTDPITLTIRDIVAGVSDYNKFLVSDSGVVKFRTGAEAYSDMDGYVTADFTTDFAAESLANLTTRTHASLSDAPTSAHHVRYADSEVESVITAELVDGQSIDLAIDALILTHKNIASAHHTKWTTGDTETVINAELVNGQSIDAAIDALILTHSGLNNIHHLELHTIVSHSDATLTDPNADKMVFWNDLNAKFEFLAPNTGLSITGTNLNCDITQYTDVMVESVITAELVNGQSIDNAIDALISTHNVANRHIDHSTVSVTAGTGLSGGGTIAADRTINCDITQYTNAMAVAAVVAQNPLSLTNAIKIGANSIEDSTGAEMIGFNGAGFIDFLAGQGTPVDNDVLAWDNATSKWTVQTQVGAGGGVTGSGTQWKLPVWFDAGGTVLDDSMVSQNSGGTLATVSGAMTVTGALKAGGDGFDVDASGNITDVTMAAATVDTDKFVVQDGSQLKYRTGTQVLSDTGVTATATEINDICDGKRPSEWPMPAFLSYAAGAYLSVIGALGVVLLPDLDNDCWFSFNIKIPSYWGAGNATIHITYTQGGIGTIYSGAWNVSARAIGEVGSINNILSGSTAYDFPSVSSVYRLAEHTIPNLAGIVADDYLGVRFYSDANNSNFLCILAVWVTQ
jgi:hypothetical protein